MKNNQKQYPRLVFLCLSLVVYLSLVIGCKMEHASKKEQAPAQNTLQNIEGTYSCTGECVTTDDQGNRTVVIVSGETDKVEAFPNAKQKLYQVRITGGDDFSELEIGALHDRTLRTATAEVSDGNFPVLEEYVFDTDATGEVVGFTKIVRNPDAKHFKACVIYGKKTTE